MRVLVVAPQPFFVERGTPIAVRLLVEELCGFGYRVDVLTYHEGANVEIAGMRLFRAGRPPGVDRIPIGISWKKLVCDLWLIGGLIGRLRQERYDVIHAVEEAIFPAALLSRWSRSKLVYDMDSSLAEQLTDKWRALRPLRVLFQAIERWAVRRSDSILPVCEDLAQKVRPWTDSGRVTVLPDVPVGSVSTSLNAEDLRHGTEHDALIALYVGNLERYQGIDLMLEGFARARQIDSMRLVVIGGEDAHIEHYSNRARLLGIDKRVSFMGARPIAALGAYLSQADVLVSPRVRGQNTPMKVYSYMQAGKAILATDIRSHTQVLDGACAELVAAESAALARGFERLARDAGYRARLGHAARARVESEYSLDAFRRRLLAAYDRLTKAPTSNPTDLSTPV